MKFRADDFPLYTLYRDRGGAAGRQAREVFNRAAAGGDRAKLNFARHLWSLPLPADGTAEMKEKTLAQCVKVFEYVAVRGYGAGALLAADAYAQGRGCRQNFRKAQALLKEARRMSKSAERDLPGSAKRMLKTVEQSLKKSVKIQK